MGVINIGIIGVGEVGNAIKQIVEKKHTVFLRDKQYDGIKGQAIENLHICIPFTSNFISLVTDAILEIRPSLTILHSTVAPKTTETIQRKTKKSVVHVPIRGDHTRFGEDILENFCLYIGSISDKDAKTAKKYFHSLGVRNIEILQSPRETELGKLFDTAYYAWNILFCKITNTIVEKYDANFEQVYKAFNTTYNQGYEKNRPEVRRPVLTPTPGPIGGHCIIPNAEILGNAIANPITTVILEQNKKLSR